MSKNSSKFWILRLVPIDYEFSYLYWSIGFVNNLSNGITVLTLLWKRHLKSLQDRVSGEYCCPLDHHTPGPDAASAQQAVSVRSRLRMSVPVPKLPNIPFPNPHLLSPNTLVSELWHIQKKKVKLPVSLGNADSIVNKKHSPANS